MTVLADVTIGMWSPLPPEHDGGVLVVVAPHPDDEILGAGMTMCWWQRHGGSVVVVGCTDGEASHAGSTAIRPSQLRARRMTERQTALDRLGLDVEVARLGLADGAMATQVPELIEALGAIVPDGATVVVPWEGDDHPDHRAAAHAGAQAATERHARLWRTPIWGKVRGVRPPGLPGHHLRLTDAAREAKAFAVAAHSSQLEPLGPVPEDGPVVHPAELAAMLDGTELLLT